MSYFAETKQTRYVFDWMPTVRVVNKAKLQAEADIIRENNAARRLADNVIETTAPSEAAAEPSSSSGPGPTVIDDDLVPTEGRAALDPVPVQLPGIHSTGRQRVGAELTSIPEALDDAHVTGCETVVLDARPVKEELPVFDTGGGQAALEGSLETGVRKRPLDAALGLAMPYHEAHPPWVTRITLSLSRTGPHQTSMLLVPFSLDGVQVFHLAAAVYGFTQGDPRRLQLRLMAGPLLRNSGFFILHDTAPNPFPPMEPLRLEYLVPQPSRLHLVVLADDDFSDDSDSDDPQISPSGNRLAGVPGVPPSRPQGGRPPSAPPSPPSSPPPPPAAVRDENDNTLVNVDTTTPSLDPLSGAATGSRPRRVRLCFCEHGSFSCSQVALSGSLRCALCVGARGGCDCHCMACRDGGIDIADDAISTDGLVRDEIDITRYICVYPPPQNEGSEYTVDCAHPLHDCCLDESEYCLPCEGGALAQLRVAILRVLYGARLVSILGSAAQRRISSPPLSLPSSSAPPPQSRRGRQCTCSHGRYDEDGGYFETRCIRRATHAAWQTCDDCNQLDGCTCQCSGCAEHGYSTDLSPPSPVDALPLSAPPSPPASPPGSPPRSPSPPPDDSVIMPSTGTRRGRAAYVEVYPDPQPGDRAPFTNLPSMPTPVDHPALEGALPATDDPLSDLHSLSRSHLYAMQRSDPLLGDVIAAHLSPDRSETLSAGARWHLQRTELGEDGILYFCSRLATLHSTPPCADRTRRVFLPTALIPAVCSIFHDRVGHHGHGPTLREVSSRFYSPRLRRAVRDYCLGCGPCCKGKVDRHRAGQPRALDRGEHPFDIVTMDVYEVGFLHDGFDNILIMVCNLTGWIRVAALKGPGTARQLLAIFRHEIIRNEGTPRVLRSDQGSNLIGEVWKLFCAAYRIDPEAGSAYTHSTAAIAERFLASLGISIRIHKIASRQQGWVDYIHKIEVAFNFKYGGPFYLNRGRYPRFPYDLALYGVAAMRARCIDGSDWLEEHVDAWHAAWDAKNRVHRQNYIRQIERRAPGMDAFAYKVNDPVLLKRFSADGKWCNPFFDEPYRVGKVLDNDRYELRDLHNNRMRGPISARHLKPYPVTTNDGEVNPDDDEYFVEKIVARRLVSDDDGNPALMYRARFRNYGKEDDWWYFAEEVPNLHNLIRVFDTVIKPLSMAERDALEGFADRVIIDEDRVAPPRRPRKPEDTRHFRHHPHGKGSHADAVPGDIAADAPAAETTSERAADDAVDPPPGSSAPDAACVDADGDDVAPVTVDSAEAAAADLENLLPLDPSDFAEADGTGILDIRYLIGPATPAPGQQQFQVGRRGATGVVRKQWLPSASLTKSERDVARRYRAARDAGLI